MRSWPGRSDIVVLGVTLVSAMPLAAQDSTTAMPRAPDSVRVWVPSLNLDGARGVIRRQTPDTVYFNLYYPVRSVSLDTRVLGSQIARMEVRDGAHRSGTRVATGAAFGAMIGGMAAGVGYYFAQGDSCNGYVCNGPSGAARPLASRTLSNALIGSAVGAAIGAVIGSRPTSRWRQVYP